jgi:hypothetical protein
MPAYAASLHEIKENPRADLYAVRVEVSDIRSRKAMDQGVVISGGIRPKFLGAIISDRTFRIRLSMAASILEWQKIH